MVTWHGLSCIQPSVTSLSSALVNESALKLFPPDAHGIRTLLKPVFNVIPLGRHTCRFEFRWKYLIIECSVSSFMNPTSDTNL
jgi:hypothetical protein